MKKTETRIAFISLLGENMVLEEMKKGVVIEESDIRENTKAALTLTRGERFTALLDTRGKNVTITNKAMKYGASSKITKERIATAHLTNSISGRLFANLFMKFFKPQIHNRMFADKKEAIKWLKKFTPDS